MRKSLFLHEVKPPTSKTFDFLLSALKNYGFRMACVIGFNVSSMACFSEQLALKERHLKGQSARAVTMMMFFSERRRCDT